MKNFLSCTTCILILCMLFTSVPALASGTTVDASYNPANGIVTVNGNAQGHTSIRIVPYDFDMSQASADNLYTDFEQIYTNGSYTCEFVMPLDAAYGKYAVYVNDGTVASDGFMYYNTEAADNIMAELNSQTSGTALASKISANAGTLGIDKDDKFYISNASAAADILCPNLMPFTDSTDFFNKHNGALAMSAMSGTQPDTVESLLSLYQTSLGIDFAAYSELDEEHKQDICTLLSDMDFKEELSLLKDNGETVSFANILSKTTALSAVRTADNWIQIRDAFVTDYNDILGSIITGNASYKSSMESDVFSRLANDGSFNSFSDLQQSFDDAVAYVKNQNQNDNKTSKPSGGGGGGGFVSIPSTNVVPNDEYDDETAGGAVTQIRTSVTAPVLGDAKAAYSDLYESNWEYTAVSSLGGNGIISGYPDGSYGSYNMITRAEFTKLIAAAFSIEAAPVEFSDVSSSDWFYPYVSVAAGAEIIQGYDGKFNPNANITRQDAAVIIYRLSAKLDKDYYGSVNFGDLNDVSLYAITAVRGLGSAGIINGDNNMNFNPQNNLTRAEAAQLLYNFIAELAK